MPLKRVTIGKVVSEGDIPEKLDDVKADICYVLLNTRGSLRRHPRQNALGGAETREHAMKRFTNAGRLAITNGNLYVALTTALTLPDICGGLESPKKANGPRYEAWCEQWLIPRLTFKSPDGTAAVFLSGADCYRLRCSLIHDGQTEIKAKVDGQQFDFEFCDQTYGSHWNKVQNKVVIKSVTIIDDAYLQIKADRFSEAVFDAVDAWDEAMATNSSVQQEKKKLLYIRSAGDPPRSTLGISIAPGHY